MKQKDQNQKAGVWLDSQTAFIIDNISDKTNNDYSIQHKVKGNASQGGGSEHSMNNAKQSDNIKYYKSISTLLLKYDEILLFGPGKAQEQFFNYLKDDAQFKSKQMTITNTQQLTEPQIIAKVSDRFS